GVQLGAQGTEAIAREQIAEARAPGARHSATQEIRDLPRGSLGSLQRDVTAIALRHDDVGSAPADAVALDETDVFKLREVHRTQQFRRLANFLMSLHLLNPDVEQSHGRPLAVEQ